MTVEEARKARVCRICGGRIQIPAGGSPQGWDHEFGRMVYPEKITLNFGDEFAHTDCLEPGGEGTGGEHGGAGVAAANG
jgi:hypothetical protein